MNPLRTALIVVIVAGSTLSGIRQASAEATVSRSWDAGSVDLDLVAGVRLELPDVLRSPRFLRWLHLLVAAPSAALDGLAAPAAFPIRPLSPSDLLFRCDNLHQGPLFPGALTLNFSF